MKPLLDRVIKELTDAGMLPDPDAGMGAVGRSTCLSCNRPMNMAVNHQPVRSVGNNKSFPIQLKLGRIIQNIGISSRTAWLFSLEYTESLNREREREVMIKSQFTQIAPHSCTRSAPYFRNTVGSRMEKATSSPLQVNKPTSVLRGGFRMPQSIGNQHERLRSRTPGGGSRGASRTPRLPQGFDDSFVEHRLPGIPSILDGVGGEGGQGVDGVGMRRGNVNMRANTSMEAPYRGRFVQDSSAGRSRGPRPTASSNSRRM